MAKIAKAVLTVEYGQPAWKYGNCFLQLWTCPNCGWLDAVERFRSSVLKTVRTYCPQCQKSSEVYVEWPK